MWLISRCLEQCYRHVPYQLRRKLDDKSEQMIFLGYHSTGGYKLLNPRNNKIIVSRDIVFDEQRERGWSDQGKQSTKLFLDLSGSDANEITTEPTPEVRRSQKRRQLPQRLQNFKMVTDSDVTTEGELIHFALLLQQNP